MQFLGNDEKNNSQYAVCDATWQTVIKRACFRLRIGAVRPNFTGTGSSPVKMLMSFHRMLIALYNFDAGRRLLVLFCRNVFEKLQILVSESHFEEVRGDA